MSSKQQIPEWFRTAMRHQQAGQFDRAEEGYRAVLKKDRMHVDALHYLGLLLSQRAEKELEAPQLWEEAVRLMRKSVDLSPNKAHYHANLAEVLRRTGSLSAAIESARRSIALKHDDAEAYFILGRALQDRCLPDEAETEYRRALQLAPHHVKAMTGLANVLYVLGRIPESLGFFAKAAALAPDNAEVFNDWGLVLLELHQLEESFEKTRRATELNPSFHKAWGNMARAQATLGNPDDAIRSFEHALKLNSRYALGHSNMLFVITHQPEYDNARLHAEHKRWGELHAQTHESRPHDTGRDPNRKLRVGYVSADLREHPVAYFIEPLLERHDREQYELVCYDAAPTQAPDPIRERLRSHVERWQIVGPAADALLADSIRDDAIDILVDLSGHTGGHRLLVFPYRPAPVQMTYLGYQTTTGVPDIRYRITDAIVDPPGLTDPFHTEELLRLDAPFACYRPIDGLPDPGPVPSASGKPVVFGSFTKVEKFSSVTLDLWAAAMHAVPGSRLLVVAGALHSKRVSSKLRAEFDKRGIAEDRLMLQGSTSLGDYFLKHSEIDVILDSYPFNGHTTSCHALWMGVPVISMAGDRYASRMGLALNHYLGLPELVATEVEGFARIAAGLALDTDRLVELRRTLRDRMRASPIMDEPRFVAAFEGVLRDAWTRWCRDREP